MEFKGSQTEKNILTAFAGESQARNKYTFFAKKAKKEGYEQISAIFEETANQESAHAKILFKLLEGGEATVNAAFPAGVIGTTAENLKGAAAGEDYETTEMYPGFAKIAEDEGFKAIAGKFSQIAIAEERHRDRYLTLLKNVEEGNVFSRPGANRWVCRKCGFVHEGTEAVNVCPACGHPQGYFEIEAVNY